MAYTGTINPTAPSNGVAISGGAAEIRATKLALQERLASVFVDEEADPLVLKDAIVGLSQLKAEVGVLPSGVVVPYAATSAPTGWLLCNGAAVSRATYAALFSLIGTAYGAGDGSTTFNVPDLRGRVPLGVGTGSGLTARVIATTGGAEEATITDAELPAHTHGFTTSSSGSHNHAGSTAQSDGAHTHDIPQGPSDTGGDLFLGASGSETGIPTSSDGAHTHNLSISADGSHTHTGTTNSEGDGDPLGIMNPFLALTYIIKT